MTRHAAVTDTVVVAAAGSAPIWASALGDVNEVLTTVSLILAIGLTLGRVIFWWIDRRNKKK
jgi:uncharacterized membrane protein YdjX (TVP38/TMEM64 family)